MESPEQSEDLERNRAKRRLRPKAATVLRSEGLPTRRGRPKKNENGTIDLIHETGHLLGFEDRYSDVKGADGKNVSETHKGYENDLMGGIAKPNLVQSHYDDIGQEALGELQKGNTSFLIKNFIDASRKSSPKE